MNKQSKQLQKLLLFQLAGHRLFGLGTLKIREIMPLPHLTKLPSSQGAVIGTATFRGAAVPIIDMAAAIGYPPLTGEERANATVIVTDVNRTEIGFMVRNVQRIVETDWKDVSPPPKALGRNAFITGLVTIDEDLIQLLDLELLLAKVYPESLSSKDVLLNDMEVETLRGFSILMVDDSVVARKQLSVLLDSKNIDYQVTHNGNDALERMINASEQGNPVDILVSDIEMPGLDGYELAFQIRNNKSLHQPWIILHSSLSSEMSLSYAEQVGADRALTKFDAHELLHTMLDAAAGRKQ
ncbi:chemotaxis protein [Oceanisphaera pacifica]|uniref:Chemotaxis protein CheV n=1 Tax=Oceanisphaera pacifica TaxID=2818389 RepID=A0ABS3NH29_9GAMM|nr:chemotaxis protein [Oceanisphaera pacifica]MBO1519898.1 chemotaxis protein CheV [Oceanisphaera pacifica]